MEEKTIVAKDNEWADVVAFFEKKEKVTGISFLSSCGCSSPSCPSACGDVNCSGPRD